MFWRTILYGLFCGLAGAGGVWILQFAGFGFKPSEMGFGEFIALLMGAATLMLTLIGFLIAILSVWGFNNIKSDARSAAMASTINQFLNAHFLRMLAS